MLTLILPCAAAAADNLPRGSPLKPTPGYEAPTPPANVSAPRPAQPGARAGNALPGQNSFYDPANPAFAQLQKANESMAGLPLDRAGGIDWMRLINEGRIDPRASLDGKTKPQVLELDVILKNTRQMPWVRFPHRSHTLWLDCANCHPQPFAQKAGSAQMSMEAIFRGQWCGMCHDRVAFITHYACDRCHSVPNPAAAQAPQ